MAQRFFRQNLLLLLLLSATSLVLGLSAFRLSGLPADDAFIHRRIALHYLQTGHAYFNLDQRVMVTSSPLWTVLLAFAGAPFPSANPVPWLELIFVLTGATAAYLLAQEGSPKDARFAGIIPALAFLCVCAGDLPTAIAQMESPCAVAFMLAGTLGILRNKFWGMPLLVLACFTRYECGLFLVLASVWLTYERRWTKSSLIAACGVGILGITWLLRQYGTIIPNTVIAKSRAYTLTYEIVISSFIASKLSAVVCIAFGVLWWFYGRNRRCKHNFTGILLSSFGLLLWVSYVAHKTFISSWYLPLVLVPVSVGVLLWTDRKEFRREAWGVVFAVAVLFPFLHADASLFLGAIRKTPDRTLGFESAARVHEYQRIGSTLYRVCPDGDLMTSEIGGLGWGFHGKILDGLGLASPEAIRYHPIHAPGGSGNRNFFGIISGIPADFVRDRHPDIIVSYDMFAETALPAALSLNYVEFSYPLFDREDRTTAKSLWTARRMLVLVSPNGRCSPAAIDSAVRMELEK
jgi:hypothetical protein